MSRRRSAEVSLLGVLALLLILPDAILVVLIRVT